MRIIGVVVKAFFRFVYFLLALAPVALLILFFGRPILGPFLLGSDNVNFLVFADWLGKWFPKIPFWYPQQGGGVSFTSFYPIFSHLIVVAATKLFSLPLLVTFRVFALLSVFLTALGIYLLAVRMTKNQTIAALAALFYPLSPITWPFLLDWGFFAEHSSYFFIPPAIIFLDIYLVEVFESRKTALRRLALFLFVVFATLTLFTHPSSLVGLLTLAGPFFIIYPLVLKTKGKKKLLVRSIKAGIVSIGLLSLAVLFWVVPYQRYRKAVRKESSQAKAVFSKNLHKQNAIYFKNVFNLSTEIVGYKDADDPAKPNSSFAWQSVVFSFGVSLFALIGLVGAFFLCKKLLALGLANLLPLTLAICPDLAFLLRQSQLPLLSQLSSWRAMIIPSRIVVPLLAGFGFHAVASLVLSPLKLILTKIRIPPVKVFFKTALQILTAGLTLVIAGVALYRFKNWPDNPPYILSYGPEAVMKEEMFDLRDVWAEKDGVCLTGTGIPEIEDNLFCQNEALKEKFWAYQLSQNCDRFKEKGEILSSQIEILCQGDASPEVVEAVWLECQETKTDPIWKRVCGHQVIDFWDQVAPKNWFRFKPSSSRDLLKAEKLVIESLPDDPKTRVDVATNLGGILMALPYYSSTPQLPVYFNQSSLMNSTWNYQLASFYNPETVWPQPEILDQLAEYFGLEYVILSEKVSLSERYRSESWERFAKVDEEFLGGAAIWRYKNPTGLLTATTRPLVLVIGQAKLDAYFRIFHLGNIGGLAHEEAILIKGGERLEDYSAEELSQFEVIVFDGYRYQDREKAWSLLDDYLKEGGSLYLNTGWQYSSADWELEVAPDFFPTTKLEWTEIGTAADYLVEDFSITGGVDGSLFSPLIFDDVAWGISSAERSDLRDWAEVILSAGDWPLIAGGRYGGGRVIWTGLDLAGHIGSYEDNPEEVKLFHNLMTYLLPEKESQEVKIDWTRSYPDRVEFEFLAASDRKTAVYWREARHPDFRATLFADGKKKGIPVYKAGPGMALFVLPRVSAGSRIVYEYRRPLSISLARWLSLAVLVGLAVNVLRPEWFRKGRRVFSRSRGLVKSRLGNLVTSQEDKEAGRVY